MAMPKADRGTLTGQHALGHAVERLSAVDARYRLLHGTAGTLKQIAAVFGADSEATIVALIRATAIAFDHKIYATLPILRPYTVRDGSKRKRGGVNRVEQWGVPQADGYFCDDNSLLKRLPRELYIRSSDPVIDGRRVEGGWTACHAWRALDDLRQASSYGQLNSFVPVLVWVPSVLSAATDREGSPAQILLKAFADSFRSVPTPAALTPYIKHCWELLGAPQSCGPAHPQHEFIFTDEFVRKRVVSMRGVSEALKDITEMPGRKVLSSRYTNGLAGLDPQRAVVLSAALMSYADSVEHALGVRTESTYIPFPG